MADHLSSGCPDCGEQWITGEWIAKSSYKSGKTAIQAVCATAEDVSPTGFRGAVTTAIEAVTGAPKAAMDLVSNLQDQIDLEEYEEVCMKAQGLEEDGDQWVCENCGYVAYDKEWAD